MDKFTRISLKILKDSLQVKKTDKVCLVKDQDTKIVNSFENALKSLKINYKVIKIRLNRDNSSPIPEANFTGFNVIIAPTKHSITHSPETVQASKKGAKIVTLPGITDEIYGKILNANFKEMEKLNSKIYEQVKNAKEIKITNKSGTNVSIKVDKTRGWVKNGFYVENFHIENLPAGEIFCAPIENGCNGIIFIDYWDKITPKNKAYIKVKNGKIVSYNKSASSYVKKLLSSGKTGLIIAELGIGTNKSHKKCIGNILNDEKVYGTCHIAFGMNTGFGGVNKANVHEDVILSKSKILVDGKVLKY